MKYATSIERRAKRIAVLEVLEIRFSSIPGGLVEKINQLNDLDFLSFPHKTAAVVECLEVFEEALDQTSDAPVWSTRTKIPKQL